MPYSLLLVGAGQLGSRYLQGMVSAKCQLEIAVVDPSSSALETAKSRWVEAGGEHCHHRIRWENDIPPELETIDLALVVTSAKGRAELVQKIASQMAVRYWVLEKVLAQSVGELDIINRATAQSNGAWVNKPFRMMRWHKSLKELFVAKGPLKVRYSGGLWGLACNSIHYIDLVAWFTSELLVSISTNRLDQTWHESKRVGYFEVTGEMDVIFSRGSRLQLEARIDAKTQLFQIELVDGTVWEIDEVAGIAKSSSGAQVVGYFEFQSQLSGRLVDDILLRGQCDLPSLRESVAMHTSFLESMLMHWNFSQKRNDVCVPIT